MIKRIVVARCRGADMLGERYAKENGYKIERYPARWEKYGKSMGTKSMIYYATKMGKPIKIKRI